jgi:hypothetical protein
LEGAYLAANDRKAPAGERWASTHQFPGLAMWDAGRQPGPGCRALATPTSPTDDWFCGFRLESPPADSDLGSIVSCDVGPDRVRSLDLLWRGRLVYRSAWRPDLSAFWPWRRWNTDDWDNCLDEPYLAYVAGRG